MKTKETAAVRDRFIGIYLELQAWHGFTDVEFLERIGYKSASFIADILSRDQGPSIELLAALKNEFPEVDMNRFFAGPAPQVVRTKQNKQYGSPKVMGWRLEKKQKQLEELKNAALPRLKEIALSLPTLAPEDIIKVQQEADILKQQLVQAEKRLEAFKRKIAHRLRTFNQAPSLQQSIH